MVYLLETPIADQKSLYVACRKIFGLGKKNSSLICKKLGFSNNYKSAELSNSQILKFLKLIETSNVQVNAKLKKNNSLLLKKLLDIKLVRALRVVKGLPVRGQRTHTNARTAKKRGKKN